MDTGTTLITGPPEDVPDFLKKLELDDCSDHDKLPVITFVIGGENYDLDPSEYILTYAKDGTDTTMDELEDHEIDAIPDGQC